jgi:regulatory protein
MVARRSRAGMGKVRPATSEGRAEAVDPLDRARDICLRQLTDGPRTAAQLATVMARRGVDPDMAEAVLARLTDVGLIDDAAFAAAWVTSRHGGRGLARRALAHELRSRGVPDAVVAEAVAELDPDREAATARELAARRLAATRDLDPAVRFRRAAALLARKGYSSQLSYRVIREALEAEGAADDVPDLPGALDD